MPRFLRHCLARLRLPALAVLLLAVTANPLLAALGDLHELGSGSEHLHTQAEHADGGTRHEAPGDNHDDGDLLHALMHASHCCGHPSAVVPAVLAALPRTPVLSPRSTARAWHAPAPLQGLLRPPIAA
jgi:hypothetical protein